MTNPFSDLPEVYWELSRQRWHDEEFKQRHMDVALWDEEGGEVLSLWLHIAWGLE